MAKTPTSKAYSKMELLRRVSFITKTGIRTRVTLNIISRKGQESGGIAQEFTKANLIMGTSSMEKYNTPMEVGTMGIFQMGRSMDHTGSLFIPTAISLWGNF